MKNPLEKSSHTGLYIALGAGAAIAGTLVYFLSTENGQEKMKDLLRDIGSDFVSQKTGLHKRTVRKAAEHIG